MPDVEDVVLVEDLQELEARSSAPEPTRTVIIPALEAQTRTCPRRYRSLIPDDRAVDVLSNKAAFAAFVDAHDLSHLCPRTYRDLAQARYPLALKRTKKHGGQGVARAGSPSELEALLEQETWRERAVVLQDWVEGGVEYVTHLICKDGQVLWDCTFEYRLPDGTDVRTSRNFESITRVDTDPGVVQRLSAFLAPLGYTGPCNADYKRSDDGSVMVFEINPRLGHSLMMPEHVEDLRDALSYILANAA
jgi:carbamoylphosphate synthase large subunit